MCALRTRLTADRELVTFRETQASSKPQFYPALKVLSMMWRYSRFHTAAGESHRAQGEIMLHQQPLPGS